MIAMTTTCILWLLTACAVGYALWTVWYLFRESRRSNRRPPVSGTVPRRKEIIGKSRFVLARRHSLPQAAVAAKTEKGIEKEPIFASASVPERPRQIPPEELDEVFGDVPAGEQNAPLEIDYPLYEEPFPDTEADYLDEEEDDTEELPLLGRSLAQGIRFEQMGEVYRHVVHDPPITDEQKEETGRLLLGLKETDLFEAIVSSRPDGNDRVKNLIDTYLSAFHRRMAAGAAESPSPQGVVPEGFDVRDYV